MLSDEGEINGFADAALAALEAVFATIDEVRTTTITEAIDKELHGQAMSVFVNETIQELDEIAGRYETGAVWIEETTVISLDPDEVRYRGQRAFPHRSFTPQTMQLNAGLTNNKASRGVDSDQCELAKIRAQSSSSG